MSKNWHLIKIMNHNDNDNRIIVNKSINLCDLSIEDKKIIVELEKQFGVNLVKSSLKYKRF